MANPEPCRPIIPITHKYIMARKSKQWWLYGQNRYNFEYKSSVNGNIYNFVGSQFNLNEIKINPMLVLASMLRYISNDTSYASKLGITDIVKPLLGTRKCMAHMLLLIYYYEDYYSTHNNQDLGFEYECMKVLSYLLGCEKLMVTNDRDEIIIQSEKDLSYPKHFLELPVSMFDYNLIQKVTERNIAEKQRLITEKIAKKSMALAKKFLQIYCGFEESYATIFVNSNKPDLVKLLSHDETWYEGMDEPIFHKYLVDRALAGNFTGKKCSKCWLSKYVIYGSRCTHPNAVMPNENAAITIGDYVMDNDERLGLECIICKANYKDRVAECGHCFCHFCLEKWPKDSCPTCRKSMGKIKVLHLN